MSDGQIESRRFVLHLNICTKKPLLLQLVGFGAEFLNAVDEHNRLARL